MSQLIYKNHLLDVKPTGETEFPWEGLIFNSKGKLADFQASEEWFELDEFDHLEDAAIALKVGCMILDEYLNTNNLDKPINS